MVAKFPDFDAYQLGKYNKERAIKRKIKDAKTAKAQAAQSGEGSMAASMVPRAGEKPMLTLKQMIRQLHIAAPVNSVMCLLGALSSSFRAFPQ